MWSPWYQVQGAYSDLWRQEEKEVDLLQVPTHSGTSLPPGQRASGTHGDRASASLDCSPWKPSSKEPLRQHFNTELCSGQGPAVMASSCASLTSYSALISTLPEPVCPATSHTLSSELLASLLLRGGICAKCHSGAKSIKSWALIRILVALNRIRAIN